MKKYRLAANLVFVTHMLVILTIIFGGLISQEFVFWHKLRAGILLATIVGQVLFLGCPLTTLEYSLRKKYSPHVKYYGSFTAHYLLKLGIKPPHILIVSIGYAVISISIVVYIVAYGTA